MRLFVAVNFPDPVRASLSDLVEELAAEDLPVRWTSPERLHLTLRWLGDRSSEERRAAERVLRDVAVGTEPFEARFGGLGAFPTPRRPQVVWVAVDGGPRLRVLRDGLERGFAAAGLGRDRRSFRPHVTLGRARSGAAPGAFRRFAAASGRRSLAVTFEVRAVDLVRSRLHPEGARYERLARVPFGDAALPTNGRDA